MPPRSFPEPLHPPISGDCTISRPEALVQLPHGSTPRSAGWSLSGLDHDVGHPSCLWPRDTHLSTGGKRLARTPASCCVATSGRRGDRSRKLYGTLRCESGGKVTNNFAFDLG